MQGLIENLIWTVYAQSMFLPIPRIVLLVRLATIMCNNKFEQEVYGANMEGNYDKCV